MKRQKWFLILKYLSRNNGMVWNGMEYNIEENKLMWQWEYVEKMNENIETASMKKEWIVEEKKIKKWEVPKYNDIIKRIS